MFSFVKCAGLETTLLPDPSNVFTKDRGWAKSHALTCPPNSSLKGKVVSASVLGLPPFIVYTPFGVKGAEVEENVPLIFSFMWMQ